MLGGWWYWARRRNAMRLTTHLTLVLPRHVWFFVALFRLKHASNTFNTSTAPPRCPLCRVVPPELSPLFHLPRYAGQKSKFRSLSGNSNSSKQLADKCTTCCKLTFHGLFLLMTTMCLFYRRSVRHSYDASHSIKAALFDTTFTGDNYTAAPFPVTVSTPHVATTPSNILIY